jgi:hypothetical protein
VESIELLIGQTKPSAVEASDPLMCEREDQEPHQQYSVIDDRAPRKKASCEFNAHLLRSDFDVPWLVGFCRGLLVASVLTETSDGVFLLSLFRSAGDVEM